MQDKAIALHDVDLSLGRGAARVHILKGISLDIAKGEAVGLVGPSGSGKSTLLMTMAGLERPDSRPDRRRRHRSVRPRRGCAGALSRPPHRHRVPVLPPRPHHDGPGKRGACPSSSPARTMPSSGPRPSCRRWASATACIIIRRSSRAASSSAWRSPAPSCPIRRSWWRTSPPAISTRPPASPSSTCSSPSSATGARPWCS